MSTPGSITADQIHRWVTHDAWHTHKNLRALFDGKSIAPLAVCDLDIPVKDRLWILLRPDIIPERELRLLACDFAEHVLYIFERDYPGNNHVRDLIETARDYVRGEVMLDAMDIAQDCAQILWRKIFAQKGRMKRADEPAMLVAESALSAAAGAIRLHNDTQWALKAAEGAVCALALGEAAQERYTAERAHQLGLVRAVLERLDESE